MERIGRPPGVTGRELLAVARGLFLEQGFSRTSMDEVARVARISKATLYREHPTKADLYAAVVADWSETGRDAMRPALDDLVAAEDLRAGLVAFGEALRRAATSDPVVRMRRLVISEADAQPEVSARYAADSWDRNVDALADGFAQLAHRGALTMPSPRAAAEQFVWLLLGATLNARLLGGGAAASATVADAVDLFLARYETRFEMAGYRNRKPNRPVWNAR